jgi:hypothetical protein
MAPADALEMLQQVNLPNTTKVVVTQGKFDTQKAAKTFNLEAGYPPDPPRLHSVAAWAGMPVQSAAQHSDGLDLFALRAVILRDGPFDYAVLLRGRTSFDDRWAELREQVNSRLFVVFQEDVVLFDLRGPLAAAFLDRAWELYVTGTVYAIAGYSLQAGLALAADAVRLEREMAGD